MKFKPGNEVICIQNVDYEGYLTIGKKYIITNVGYDRIRYRELVYFQPDNDSPRYIKAASTRFLSINEFEKTKRKDKLNQINSLSNEI